MNLLSRQACLPIHSWIPLSCSQCSCLFSSGHPPWIAAPPARVPAPLAIDLLRHEHCLSLIFHARSQDSQSGRALPQGLSWWLPPTLAVQLGSRQIGHREHCQSSSSQQQKDRSASHKSDARQNSSVISLPVLSYSLLVRRGLVGSDAAVVEIGALSRLTALQHPPLSLLAEPSAAVSSAAFSLRPS